MEKFPLWKDDGLDMLSYIYDVLKEHRFSPHQISEESKVDVWERARRRAEEKKMSKHGWISV